MSNLKMGRVIQAKFRAEKAFQRALVWKGRSEDWLRKAKSFSNPMLKLKAMEGYRRTLEDMNCNLYEAMKQDAKADSIRESI